MKMTFIAAAALVASFVTPAFAANEFYLVQDTATKKCSIVEAKPTMATTAVVGAAGRATPRQAESLGLIVTELVMNALKHAFPDSKAEGQINVVYDTAGTDWRLSVSDNGIGKPDGVFAQGKTGLGTGIIKALAQQLDAKLVTLSGLQGTTVSITHATFEAKEIRAA